MLVIAIKSIKQKEGTSAAMNKTGTAAGNNGTQGAGAALQNQTSKGLSNAAGSIMQGVKNIFGGKGGNEQK